MTNKQYREAIAELGLNQTEASAFLGVSARTSRTYAASGTPRVVEMLLRLMIVNRISVAEVERMMKRKP